RRAPRWLKAVGRARKQPAHLPSAGRGGASPPRGDRRREAEHRASGPRRPAAPGQPRHPLCGLIAALRFAAARPRPPAVVAVACDMPFVTGPLLGWLAVLDGAAMAHVGGRPQPLLGRWPVGGLPLVAQALGEGRPLRSALAALEPTIVAEDELGRSGDPARLCSNVNDPADLRTARQWLAADEP